MCTVPLPGLVTRTQAVTDVGVSDGPAAGAPDTTSNSAPSGATVLKNLPAVTVIFTVRSPSPYLPTNPRGAHRSLFAGNLSIRADGVLWSN